MGIYVCTGAMLQCSMGLAPSTFAVLPDKRVMVSNMPMANIMDFKPMVNIPPFGMCQSMANPVVASATAAAYGVLTPMPCIPVPAGPWIPGEATVMVANMPALTSDCKLMCNWAGSISITNPGQTTTMT